MKAVKSKLVQFAGPLADMDAEKKTLAEMQAWLKAEGCEVSAGRLSVFLESQRSARSQAAMLGQITSGARQCREVEKEFSKNAAPELETLIKLHRVLILKLSTQAAVAPEMFELISQAMRPVMEAEKLKLKREEVSLAKEKFQRETAELFMRWHADKAAQEVLRGNTTNADKIEQLGQIMFGENWK